MCFQTQIPKTHPRCNSLDLLHKQTLTNRFRTSSLSDQTIGTPSLIQSLRCLPTLTKHLHDAAIYANRHSTPAVVFGVSARTVERSLLQPSTRRSVKRYCYPQVISRQSNIIITTVDSVYVVAHVWAVIGKDRRDIKLEARNTIACTSFSTAKLTVIPTHTPLQLRIIFFNNTSSYARSPHQKQSLISSLTNQIQQQHVVPWATVPLSRSSIL